MTNAPVAQRFKSNARYKINRLAGSKPDAISTVWSKQTTFWPGAHMPN